MLVSWLPFSSSPWNPLPCPARPGTPPSAGHPLRSSSFPCWRPWTVAAPARARGHRCQQMPSPGPCPSALVSLALVPSLPLEAWGVGTEGLGNGSPVWVLGLTLSPSPASSAAVGSGPPPEAEQAWPQSSGEEELQLQLALAMSKEEADQVRAPPHHGGCACAFCPAVLSHTITAPARLSLPSPCCFCRSTPRPGPALVPPPPVGAWPAPPRPRLGALLSLCLLASSVCGPARPSLSLSPAPILRPRGRRPAPVGP